MNILQLIAALEESQRVLGGDAPVTVWVSQAVLEESPAEHAVEDIATRQTPDDSGCMLVIEYQWPSYQDRMNARYASGLPTAPHRHSAAQATAIDDDSSTDMRDQFARTALNGLLASQSCGVGSPHWLERLTETAYKIADAMLAERALAPRHAVEDANCACGGRNMVTRGSNRVFGLLPKGLIHPIRIPADMAVEQCMKCGNQLLNGEMIELLAQAEDAAKKRPPTP